MIEYWHSFIDFCNNGNQWVFYTSMVIFWAICYLITTVEMWLSDKMTKAMNITYKQALRSTFIHNGDFDIFNVFPYIIFSPGYCVLSTIIFIISIFYWLVCKIIKIKKAKKAKAEDTHSLFLDWLNTNQDPNNMLPPPIDSNLAIKFLKDYLLGENWYVAYSAPSSQVNTDIVFSILKSYSKKFRKELKREEKNERKGKNR